MVHLLYFRPVLSSGTTRDPSFACGSICARAIFIRWRISQRITGLCGLAQHYYITGILGEHQNLPGICKGGPPRDSIKFRIPYAYLEKLCREYGLKTPSDNNPVSSGRINRFLMDIEEDFISHRN